MTISLLVNYLVTIGAEDYIQTYCEIKHSADFEWQCNHGQFLLFTIKSKLCVVWIVKQQKFVQTYNHNI